MKQTRKKRAPKEKEPVLLRLPQSLFTELRRKAQIRGVPLNGLICALLDEGLHPELRPTGSNPQDIEINTKLARLETLLQKRDDILNQMAGIRMRSAQNAPNNIDLQEEILALLKVSEMTETSLARETQHKPETIYFLLCAMEQAHRVKFDEKTKKWRL